MRLTLAPTLEEHIDQLQQQGWSVGDIGWMNNGLFMAQKEITAFTHYEEIVPRLGVWRSSKRD